MRAADVAVNSYSTGELRENDEHLRLSGLSTPARAGSNGARVLCELTGNLPKRTTTTRDRKVTRSRQ